jgi:hypothetical protein
MDMITIHHVGNGSYGFISHHLNKKSYTLKISSMTIGKSIGSSYEKKSPLPGREARFLAFGISCGGSMIQKISGLI